MDFVGRGKKGRQRECLILYWAFGIDGPQSLTLNYFIRRRKKGCSTNGLDHVEPFRSMLDNASHYTFSSRGNVIQDNENSLDFTRPLRLVVHISLCLMALLGSRKSKEGKTMDFTPAKSY